jgi:eukaryotic-like serine/threonine-protein kinase
MRLTDFGIAHPEDATRLTQTGQVIGTERFMAPELRAGGDPTIRSDLYSLGVLLRECSRLSPAPDVVELAAHLSRPYPGERPDSAAEALASLGRGASPAATDELPAPEPPSQTPPPVEPARAAARRKFVHVSPARVILIAFALLAALVVAASVLDDDSGGGGPLLGPEAKQDRLEIGLGDEGAKRR